MVGSFLNVCVWRLPAGEQVVRGRSHCRACGKIIFWHDNIPVLSFLRLKGKCRFCGARISRFYPAVEAATGLWFLAVWLRWGLSPLTPIYAGLGAALILISAIDIREMVIPFEVTKPGLIAGLVLSALAPALHGTESRWIGFQRGLLGAAAGAAFVYGMASVGKRLFRKKLESIGEEEAVGGGDLWLMGMVGAFLGWGKVLLVLLFLGPMLGSVIGLWLKFRRGRDLIPYGPFLSVGSLAALFWGEAVINWYWNLLGGS